MSPNFLNKLTYYGSGVLAFLGVAYLYDKYKEKEQEKEYHNNQDLINRYLLNDKFKGQKPFIWIPLIHQKNTRMWDNFYSRSSTRLNQPYLQSTVESIIKKCGNDFNVCIIDDDSYEKLIPNWRITLTQYPEPIRTHMRKLAQMKLLYTYGGLMVPPSFLCLKSLREAYELCCPMMAFEGVNRGSSSNLTCFTPSFSFFGSTPNNSNLLDGIHYFERIVSRNYTDELKFLDEWNRWLEKQNHMNCLKVIDGTTIGIKRENREISIEEILSEQNGYHLFNQIKYGILLPQDEILKRTSYQWFARMSIDQIKQSNLSISDYFVLC
jgi:hypothetical protein